MWRSSDFKLASSETPVLVLGGKENSLSIVRHLGRFGINVKVSGPANCWGMNSRYCAERLPVPFGTGAASFWKELLLGPNSSRFHGHVIFPCSDEALEFIAAHHEELTAHFLLNSARPELITDLLDKQRTLELAQEAGVPAPRFWTVNKLPDLEKIKGRVAFPVLVKPIHSHKFVRVFGKKLFVIEKDYAELAGKVGLALEHGLAVVVVEMIPGPDTALSSFNTYITESGERLFDFTKKVIRRYPVGSGNGCYHVTAWDAETAQLGQKFFAAVGARGFANVEFKRDTRDGQLKIIESNMRFTAAHELIVRSGAPVDLIAYCHLTRQPAPSFKEYRQDLRLWYPVADFFSFLQLRKRGSLTFGQWVQSVARYPKVFPLLRFSDPAPFLFARLANLQTMIRGRG